MAKSKSGNEIAFKNFKKSVTNAEFEAVLSMANKEYSKLSEIAEKSIEFQKKSLESLDQIVGEKDSLEYKATKRVVMGLSKQASKHVIRLFGEEVERSPSVTNFINRFQKPGEELPYLNFESLNL